MPRVSTYLNFMGNTEEAFNFYKSVFGTDFLAPISRMGDMPHSPGQPELSEAEREMVMHVELPILAGHVIMGTDMLESLGHERRLGNSMTINLELEDRCRDRTTVQALVPWRERPVRPNGHALGRGTGEPAPTGTEPGGCSTVRTPRPGSPKAGRC